MIPAYNKKRCAAVPFETGIYFRRKTDFFPEEDTTMSYSGFEPEPTRLQAEGHSHHTGWATTNENNVLINLICHGSDLCKLICSKTLYNSCKRALLHHRNQAVQLRYFGDDEYLTVCNGYSPYESSTRSL
ncbi:hypothetical protein TNCV_2941511 [Trichonephila clavipes]|nr:hypothetical protein TNCV_2941511 [Trichonephila clavipes]